MASVFVVEYIRVVFFDLFHFRVVRGHSCSHQPIGVRIAIVDVDTHFRHILQYLLGAVETSRATTNDGKTVLFVRLHHMLGFDTLLKFRVVILCHIKPKSTSLCLQRR